MCKSKYCITLRRVKSRSSEAGQESIYETLPKKTTDLQDLIDRYRRLEEHAIGRLYGSVKQSLTQVPDRRRSQFICAVMEVNDDDVYRTTSLCKGGLSTLYSSRRVLIHYNICLQYDTIRYDTIMGGDLRWIGGTVPPQKLRWGDGPCIRPPNISRSSVTGCVHVKVRTE